MAQDRSPGEPRADAPRTLDPRAQEAREDPVSPRREETPHTPVHHGEAHRRSVGSRLLRALAPRFTRAQLLAALLSAVVGFALVVQVTQNQSDDLASLRQSDLVRLLDEVSQRSDALATEKANLEAQITDLQNGSDSDAAALKAATLAARTQGILSGRLPATGPGIRLDVVGDTSEVTAANLVNVLEELRNAGAEAISLNDRRIVVSTSFTDGADGVEMDGEALEAPYVWEVIGEPTTLQPALEIPGGALAVLRNAGAQAVVTTFDEVTVDAVVDPQAPRYATPSATS